VEFDAANFTRMIHERKFTLDPGMLFHDMGHMVDFIERPHYMRAYRLFVEKKSAVLANEDIPRSVVPHLMGQVGVRGDIERYMNEWLYLPSAKNLEQIQQVIPAIQTKTFNALPNIQAVYKNKSSKELLRTAKNYLKNRYVLFSSHGGGARDWSVERRLIAEYVVQGFTETLANEGKAVTPAALDRSDFEYKQDVDFAYQMHEAPGIFQRIEYLVDMKVGKKVPRVIEDSLQRGAKSAGAEIQSYIDLLLAYHLAEVEFRVQTALVFKMTPEKIATDTALLYERLGWEKYQKTDTFKFYSTYRTYTVQWVLGYDVARPSPNHKLMEWPGM
jgi:hypothetical protein